MKIKKCPYDDITKDDMLKTLTEKLGKEVVYLKELSRDKLYDLEQRVNSFEIIVRNNQSNIIASELARFEF